MSRQPAGRDSWEDGRRLAPRNQAFEISLVAPDFVLALGLRGYILNGYRAAISDFLEAMDEQPSVTSLGS